MTWGATLLSIFILMQLIIYYKLNVAHILSILSKLSNIDNLSFQLTAVNVHIFSIACQYGVQKFYSEVGTEKWHVNF